MGLITWNEDSCGLSEDRLTTRTNRNCGARSSEGVSKGRWYFELTRSGGAPFAFGLASKDSPITGDSGAYNSEDNFLYYQDGRLDPNAKGTVSTVNSIDEGDVVGFFIDLVVSEVRVFHNGSHQETVSYEFPEEVYPVVIHYRSTNAATSEVNFGATPFEILESNPNAYEQLWSEGFLPYDIENAHEDNILDKILHLIKSHNKIQSLSENNEWVDTGLTEPLTQVDFEQHGIEDLSAVPKEKWQELDDSFEVITWTDEAPVGFEDKISGSELEWAEEGKLFEMVMDDERDILKLGSVDIV